CLAVAGHGRREPGFNAAADPLHRRTGGARPDGKTRPGSRAQAAAMVSANDPHAPHAPPLVVRCGALGDMVMLSTLMRLVAARHGGPVDVVSSGGWTPGVLAHVPELGHLQLVKSRKTPYLLCPSQWELVRWLRQRGRGPVYLCDPDREM